MRITIFLGLVVLILGLLPAPVHDYVVLSIAPLALAAIAGGGALLGGALNAYSQSTANTTNLQATRETNELNERLFHENLDWQERMVNEQNEYNTPLAQRARLEAAGINPYMALGSMDVGNQQSVTGTTAPSMQAPHVNPVDFSFLGNSASQYSQVASQAEATKQIRIENQYKAYDLYAGIQEKLASAQRQLSESGLSASRRSEIRANIEFLEQRSSYLKKEIEYADDYFRARNDRERANVDVAEADARYKQMLASYQSLINDAFPSMNAAKLQLLASQAAEATQSALLHGEQRNLTAQEIKTEAMETLGKRLDTLVKRNQISLQDLDISDKSLDTGRKSDVVRIRKDSRLFRAFDSAISNTLSVFGKVLH